LAAISIFQSSNSPISAFLPLPITITWATDRSCSVHGQPISPISAPSARRITPSSPRSRSPSSPNRINTRPPLLLRNRTNRTNNNRHRRPHLHQLRNSCNPPECRGRTGSGFGDEWIELKTIPELFQKGVEEGEIEALSRKAKDMDDVSEEKEECSLWPVSVGVRSGLVLKEAKEAAMRVTKEGITKKGITKEGIISRRKVSRRKVSRRYHEGIAT